MYRSGQINNLRLRAWIIHAGDKAPRAAGKYRQEGKEYVVQDGDVLFFKFNV